jgi:hypothetical protein
VYTIAFGISPQSNGATPPALGNAPESWVGLPPTMFMKCGTVLPGSWSVIVMSNGANVVVTHATRSFHTVSPCENSPMIRVDPSAPSAMLEVYVRASSVPFLIVQPEISGQRFMNTMRDDTADVVGCAARGTLT